ncbi:MAG: S8 family serine peptidase [Oscillospiraceae bacterium]|jgi:hypothetical protein|nr:S8 family serine peptidase [Oscillospiraceae bacterium]
MKRTLSILLIVMLVVTSFASLTVFADETQVNPTPTNVVDTDDVSIGYTPTIDDNFEDNKIMVILYKAYSELNREFTEDYFSEIELVSIVDTFRIENDPENNPLVDRENFNQVLELTLPIHSKANVLEKCAILKQREDVLNAEPKYIYEDVTESIPNDAYYDDQWGFASDKCKVEDAWDVEGVGENSVTVGVREGGKIANHPDLGANLVSEQVNVQANGTVRESNSSVSDHKTFCAGIIAAVPDNNIGIAGVANSPEHPNTVKVKGIEGVFTRVFQYAANIGVSIISISTFEGGYDENGVAVYFPPNDAYRQSIDSYNGLVVCSAGNQNRDNDNGEDGGYQHFPSSYECDNIIAVAATNNTGTDLAGFSNYGHTSVDIAAPGSSIVSTGYAVINNEPSFTYGTANGTSAAAPFVAGVAALIKSKYPDMTPEAIKARILNFDTNLATLNDKVVSEGMVDAENAVEDHPITVQYNANGGSGTVANTVVDYGMPIALSEDAFTKDGYYINGWQVQDEDGKWLYPSGWYTAGLQPTGEEKTIVENNSEAVVIPTAQAATLTFYANWVFRPFQMSPNEDITDGDYYIKNVRSGKYLEVPNSATTNNTQLKQQAFTGNLNQQWQIKGYSGGFVTLNPVHWLYSSVVVSGGGQVNQTPAVVSASDDDNDRFKFYPIPSSGEQKYVIATGTTNYEKTLVVQDASLADGANVFQYDYENPNTDNDEWVLERVQRISAGRYRIKNYNSNKYLGLEDGSTEEATRVVQQEYTGDDSQVWNISSGGGTIRPVLNSNIRFATIDYYDGNDISIGLFEQSWNSIWRIYANDAAGTTYRIMAMDYHYTAYGIEMLNSSTANGTPAVLRTFNNTDNAYWVLEPVVDYTLQYNPGAAAEVVDDEDEIEPQEASYGTPTDITGEQYVLPYYVFAGWTAQRESDDKYYYVDTESTAGGWYTEDAQPAGYIKKVFLKNETVENLTLVDGDTINFTAQYLPGIMGDANLDFDLSVSDATEIQMHLAYMLQISEEGMYLADVNFNGRIDIDDATTIQKILSGMIAGIDNPAL